MSYALRYALASLSGLLFMSCVPNHPITEAVCVSQCLDSLDHARVLVWSNDPKVESLLFDWAGEQGAQVIESAAVQDAILRYHVVLEAKPGVEDVLRHLASLVEADRVLFATVMLQSHPLTQMYSGYKEGHPRVTTVFDPTVTVRSVGVVRPTTYWSVTVTGAAPTFFREPTVSDLTQTALRRATCEADPATQWTDETGCVGRP